MPSTYCGEFCDRIDLGHLEKKDAAADFCAEMIGDDGLQNATLVNPRVTFTAYDDNATPLAITAVGLVDGKLPQSKVACFVEVDSNAGDPEGAVARAFVLWFHADTSTGKRLDPKPMLVNVQKRPN